MAKDHSSAAVDYFRNPWKKFRILKTVALGAAFCGLGLAGSVLGPTLVSMEILLDTDTKSISATFTGGALGYLLGAVVCGFIYSKINKELLFSVSLVGVGLATALAPWAPHLFVFVAASVIQCFGMAMLDTAGQAYVLKLWEGHIAKQPMMQAMHSIWSVGSTIGPFIVKPFLVDISELSKQQKDEFLNQTDATVMMNITSGEYWADDSLENSTGIPPNSTESEDLKARVGFVRLAYVVLASLIFVASILFIVLFFLAKPSCRDHYQQKKNKDGEDKTEHTKSYKTFRIRLLVFMFCFYFFYLWVEGIPGSFLAAFVVKELAWPNDYGALITATYWGSHGAGRVVGIPISAVMKPRNMLIMDLVITSSGFAILLFVHYYYSLMWVGVVVAGLGMGTIFATTVLWLEEQIEITGAAASVLLAASSAGSMTGPFLTGFLFNDYSPMWFIYIVFSASLMVIVVFIGTNIFVRRNGTRSTARSKRLPEKEVRTKEPDNSFELMPLSKETKNSTHDVDQNPHNPFL